MPAKGKGKGKGDDGGKGKGDGKQIRPKDVWESLAAAAKSAGRELGYRDGEPNPIYKLFDFNIEELKDDFPNQIIFSDEIEPIAIRVLCKSLTVVNYEGLRMLRFWGVGFGDLGMKFVAEGISSLPSVTCLEILDCLVGEKGCAYLAKSLRKVSATYLKSLKLDHNNIGSGGATVLAEGLMYNTIITSLSLSHCGIDKQAGSPLGAWLGAKEVTVKTLNLEGNDLGPDGVADLSKGIQQNTSLTSLNLALNGFGGERKCMASLTAALRQNVQLKKINLDGNLIGNDGCKFLLENLQECTHITDLDITPFIDQGHLQMVFDWLAKNKPAGKSKGKKGSKKKKKK